MSFPFNEKRQETAERLGINPNQIPRKIAIIMDGNGRWAQQRGLPRLRGHHQGGKMVERIALAAVACGIEALTLYAFSSENWKRPPEEVEGLMELYTRYLIGIRPMMMKNSVRLKHVGRREMLPAKLLDSLDESISMTASNTGMVLALALNYSGRAEITDTVKKIAQEYKDGNLSLDQIDEKCISNHLYVPGYTEPDLLVRTASEMRVSNFLLWQISYSEFYVTDINWPDFDEKELDKTILVYASRTRKFGNVPEPQKS